MGYSAIDTTISIKEVEDSLSKHLDRIVNGVFLEMAHNIRDGGRYSPGTPVDTGFAAGSWWEGVNDQGQPHQPDRPDSDSPTVSVNPFGAIVGRAGDVFFLSSNCVYIRRLEYDGHSQQAPQGFVRLTVAGAQDILDAHVALAKGLP